MSDLDLSKVRAIVVEVECFHCHGKRRIPGGPYQAQGEVINCHLCNGRGVRRESLPLERLGELIGNGSPK